MDLDYRLGKIIDITRKKNGTFLLTVSFCKRHKCEEYTEIIETNAYDFEIGNMIRVYYEGDKIEMAFHEEEIDVDEFDGLVDRIPFMSEEELLGYHKILIGRNSEYTKERGNGIDEASQFMSEILSFNYNSDNSMTTVTNNVVHLKYVSDYFKNRIKSFLNESVKIGFRDSCNPDVIEYYKVEKGVKDFLESDREIKDLSGEEINEIMKEIACFSSWYRRSELYIPSDSDLYFDIQEYLFSLRSAGAKEFLGKYASKKEVMERILSTSSGTNSQKLEKIFKKLYELNSSDALKVYHFIEKGYLIPTKLKESLFSFAENDYDIVMWKKQEMSNHFVEFTTDIRNFSFSDIGFWISCSLDERQEKIKDRKDAKSLRHLALQRINKFLSYQPLNQEQNGEFVKIKSK